ncbi:YqcC family protein [uncultured Pseudomonas sp.]|uniref:YqcC family protein n=1 Tax=uncultured Pseudomonas sp. TaxID=114707 RepID=UPI0025D424BC|nr:YqcC family protein [uncultured Pseudomonas sp.]
MDERLPALADQLLQIERELRLLGWWSVHAPSAEALASQEPFCVDTLSFAQWLQWIFLPRMKLIIESNGTLPVRSGIRPMAEVVYQGDLDPVLPLLASLAEFDRLIESA